MITALLLHIYQTMLSIVSRLVGELSTLEDYLITSVNLYHTEMSYNASRLQVCLQTLSFVATSCVLVRESAYRHATADTKRPKAESTSYSHDALVSDACIASRRRFANIQRQILASLEYHVSCPTEFTP